MILPSELMRDYCWYCGLETQTEDRTRGSFGTRDHVVPRSNGGRGARNLVSACRACNNRKKNFLLHEFRQKYGGGLFWGECFHPRDDVPGALRHADNGNAFRRWLSMQLTVGADDWMSHALAAKKLRASTRDLAPIANPKYFGFKVNKVAFVGLGFRLERKSKRVAFYVPGFVIVVGMFWGKKDG